MVYNANQPWQLQKGDQDEEMLLLTRYTNLEQNEALSVHGESTHKGVNWCSKYLTQLVYLCYVL